MLGVDCFEDVDHVDIALGTKRLALTLSSYLRHRMKDEEEETGPAAGRGLEAGYVAFKTDAVLTQLTAAVAKLHRAVMKNWQHLVMLAANTQKRRGGRDKGSIDSGLNEMDQFSNFKICRTQYRSP